MAVDDDDNWVCDPPCFGVQNELKQSNRARAKLPGHDEHAAEKQDAPGLGDLRAPAERPHEQTSERDQKSNPSEHAAPPQTILNLDVGAGAMKTKYHHSEQSIGLPTERHALLATVLSTDAGERVSLKIEGGQSCEHLDVLLSPQGAISLAWALAQSVGAGLQPETDDQFRALLAGRLTDPKFREEFIAFFVKKGGADAT
jgi:hypothetical protein